MKVLFLADRFSKLKPLSDTTLVFLRQALKLGYECYWATNDKVEFENGKVFATAELIASCGVDQLPVVESSGFERLEMKQFRFVFIRKDPPFNTAYVRLCWILSLAERKTVFLNQPSLLLRFHEKLVPLEALSSGFLSEKEVIPTHVGSYETAREFVKKLGATEVILKPFLGYGGRDIIKLSAADFLAGRTAHVDMIVQPFQKEVDQGDHRVFFINGKFVGSVARIPKMGHFVSNLAAGGTAKAVKLSKTQLKVLEKLGKFLKAKKIFFAGGDLIGNLVSEVNITSPTGLVPYQQLFGEDLSVKVFKEAEKCRPK